MSDCFPDWLKRTTSQRIGPPIDDTIPYPVYQEQPLIISQDNPNSPSINVGDAFFQSFSGSIVVGNLPTTIIRINPRDAYDTILITAFDFATPVAANRGVPIFLSMDRPGRIVSETPSQGNVEVLICTATALALTDVSSFHTLSAVPTAFNVAGGAASMVTNLTLTAPKTNRPFYVWFGDGIQGVPVAGAGFSITWYVQGR